MLREHLWRVGTGKNYGWQRLWGVLGWAAVGQLVGMLVIVTKGAASVKDHSIAFIVATVFLALDIVISSFIKAPEVQQNGKVWSGAKRLLRDSKFLLFLLFSLMSGIFYWVSIIFVFIMLWQLVVGTPEEKDLEYLVLMVVFMRVLSQLPWMYNADKLFKKFGARKLYTAIFVVHTLRLSLYGAVGLWGPIWATPFVEVLDGPVYGLGYPLVVLYARQFTPPGLTNTVQSLANNAYDMLSFGIASAVSTLLMTTLGISGMFWVHAVFAALTGVVHTLCDRCGLLEKNDGSTTRVGDVAEEKGPDGEELRKLEDN